MTLFCVTLCAHLVVKGRIKLNFQSTDIHLLTGQKCSAAEQRPDVSSFWILRRLIFHYLCLNLTH